MQNLNFIPMDADQHYYEPDDCFSRHIEGKFRERVIHTIPSKEKGISMWALAGKVLGGLPNNASDRSPKPGAFEELFAGKATVQESEENLYSPKEIPSTWDKGSRLRLMDEQGVESVIMLPTVGLGVEHDFGNDAAALAANFRSFNRWVEEDWGYGNDEKIYGVPMISLLDRDFAVAETKRVAGLGAKFVYLRTGPVSGRSPADPYFDPFWGTVVEHGLKVIFHIDFSDFNELYAKHWSEDPDRTVYEYSALQTYFSILERPVSDTMAALLLHNLFGRFPELQVVTIELGSSWIRPLLNTVDKAVKFSANGKWLGGQPRELPSETFAKHVWVSPYFEDDIPDLISLIGEDRVLFGSDYPHPEGLKEPLSYANYLGGLPDPTVKKIMRGNMERLLAG